MQVESRYFEIRCEVLLYIIIYIFFAGVVEAQWNAQLTSNPCIHNDEESKIRMKERRSSSRDIQRSLLVSNMVPAKEVDGDDEADVMKSMP
jgi:hypothetical protein